MVSLHHELGWTISLQDTIDALWAGEIKFIESDEPICYRKTIGYIESGKEVLFDESTRIHPG